jgi:hypothetical protein
MVEELKKVLLSSSDSDNREHEFYLKVLGDSHKTAFDQAIEVHGLNGEIALMRVEIRSLIESDPDNIKAVQSGVLALERLVRTRYYIGKNDKEGFTERMNKLLKSIALPLSVVGANLKK